MENIKIKAVDGYELSLNIYEVENPEGYIQVIHGMQEHQNRYIKVAEILNREGYTVITNDMRGHGKNADNLGYFSNKNGHILLLEDQKEITKYIKSKYMTDKVIILAHSMGTIITRNLIQTESNDYDKVILSGYPNYQPVMKLGLLLAKTIKLFKGAKGYSELISDLSVGSFNKKIENPRTNLDWLSFNDENVDKYIADDFCGFPFTISAFIDLFTLLCNMHKKADDCNNIPLLLLAGKDDPCVGGEKGINNSILSLNKMGFNNIKNIEYDHMRHEIFNETLYQTVIDDIFSFLGGDN